MALSQSRTLEWQVVAGGSLTIMLSKMNGLAHSYRAYGSKEIFKKWLLIEVAQSGSLNKIIPEHSLSNLLGIIQNFNYPTAEIDPIYLPPQNASVSGTSITCDGPNTDQVNAGATAIQLYSWNYVDFTDMELTPTDNGDGTFTFSNLSAGNYVVAVDIEGALPSGYLTIS